MFGILNLYCVVSCFLAFHEMSSHDRSIVFLYYFRFECSLLYYWWYFNFCDIQLIFISNIHWQTFLRISLSFHIYVVTFILMVVILINLIIILVNSVLFRHSIIVWFSLAWSYSLLVVACKYKKFTFTTISHLFFS